MKKILIVEDDREIRALISGFLKENEYEVDEAADGNAASEKLNNGVYNLILMDMMLPYKSGDILIQELRKSQDLEKRNTPVVVISAKSRKDTRLEVLRMGADDYIIKPFDLDEVLVRIEVVLRRSEDNRESGEFADGNSSTGMVLSHEGLTLNKELNLVTFEDEPIKLTAKEMQLLELFLRNPQKTYTKANLYETVWNDTYYYEDNTINVHMSNLRSKLKKAAGREFIETVWGIGYKLCMNGKKR